MEEQLFITRKRKKWKFAHFAAWANCFEAEDASPKELQKYFGKKRPLVVEIGAGTADLSLAYAAERPECNFIAIDVKADRLYTGAKRAQEQDLTNIAFVRAHANQISDILSRQRVDELWITFPDPFPRAKQAKHRLTHKNFLQQYRNILHKHGALHFKTDNHQLFTWSLEQLVAEKWRMSELSFDLHASGLAHRYKISTKYERRFLADGMPIHFVTAHP